MMPTVATATTTVDTDAKAIPANLRSRFSKSPAKKSSPTKAEVEFGPENAAVFISRLLYSQFNKTFFKIFYFCNDFWRKNIDRTLKLKRRWATVWRFLTSTNKGRFARLTKNVGVSNPMRFPVCILTERSSRPFILLLKLQVLLLQ